MNDPTSGIDAAARIHQIETRFDKLIENLTTICAEHPHQTTELNQNEIASTISEYALFLAKYCRDDIQQFASHGDTLESLCANIDHIAAYAHRLRTATDRSNAKCASEVANDLLEIVKMVRVELSR